MATYHEPVLCREALSFLLTDKDGVYVDGTLGSGGHAESICEQLSPRGRLIGFDADRDAIAESGKRLQRFGESVTIVEANFRALRERLAGAKIAGLLLDLGVSSHQLDDGTRGFSFRSDDRLDMRMDRRAQFSAWDVVNTYPEEQLAKILWEYGEEHLSRRIARSVVHGRPVDTTGSLASIVEQCVGGRYLTKSLARVFQALRIEVNSELASLREVLAAVPDVLQPGGRCVVISYHSLEDRIVKDFFRAEAAERIPSGNALVPDTPRVPRLTLLTKKPVVAGKEEYERNPRARSAKLRAAARPAL